MKNKEIAMDVIDSFISIEIVKKDCKKYTLKNLFDRMDFQRCSFVFNSNLPSIMLHEYEMYFLIKSFYDWMNINDPGIDFDISLLNPKKYFTESEIDRLEYSTIEKEEISDEFVFENVDYTIKDKQYICARITAQQLGKLVDGGFVCYDFDMQREPEIVRRNGQEFKRAKLYKKSLDGISTTMRKNRYKPTAITINVLQKPNGEENLYYYDEQARTFTLYKDSYNIVIDGMHRLVSIWRALELNPMLDQVMQVNIMIYNMAEAREFIHQESLKNAISKDIIKAYSNDVYASIITALNVDLTSSDNMMNCKIAGIKEELLSGKLITNAHLSKILEEKFKISENNASEKRKVIRYLITFFNEVFSYYESEWEDVVKSRIGDTLVCYPNTFNLYMEIANRLYGVNGFEDMIGDILSDINLSKIAGDLSEIKNITSLDKDLTNKDKARIVSFVKNRLGE